MSTSYPGALDSFVNPTATDTLDSATVPHAAQHDNINDAMAAVQVTLGVNPQGGSATVVARLTALDSTVAGKAATNQTMYVGTTALAINRSSASQTLTGVSIDGNAATATSATSATSATTAGSVTNGVYTNVSNTFTTGTQIIQAGSNTTVPLRLKRNSASQTADILQANTSDDATTLAKIDKDGKITAADFIDSSMTTAGVVTNTSGGLFQSSTTLPTVTSVNSTTIPASSTLVTSSNYRQSQLTPSGAVDIIPRLQVSGTRAVNSGTISFTGFTPVADMTLSKISVNITAVSGTPTLQFGVYSISAMTATCLGVSSVSSAISTTGLVELSLTSSVSLTAGTNYLIAFLPVGGTSATFSGANINNAAGLQGNGTSGVFAPLVAAQSSSTTKTVMTTVGSTETLSGTVVAGFVFARLNNS
jgi:hypothetical protein